MKNELKLFGLVPVFGAAGAAATAAMWFVFRLTMLDLMPPQYAVLGCAVFGLVGPIAVWAVVLTSLRNATLLRWSAGVGLAIVLAAELAFYIPIGFFVVAFQHGSF